MELETKWTIGAQLPMATNDEIWCGCHCVAQQKHNSVKIFLSIVEAGIEWNVTSLELSY